LENGIYLGPSGYEVGFVSEAHSYEQLDKTASIFANGILALTLQTQN
jgi:glutamate-1-semialdehyde 2,1-aminomutase